MFCVYFHVNSPFAICVRPAYTSVCVITFRLHLSSYRRGIIRAKIKYEQTLLRKKQETQQHPRVSNTKTFLIPSHPIPSHLPSLLPIPREILRIDSRARQIRQPTLSQIQLQEVPHQWLDSVLGFVFYLLDTALEPAQIIAVVVVRAEAQKALAFVVVEIAGSPLAKEAEYPARVECWWGR